MFNTLKSKINSWSLSKLTEHAGYLPTEELGNKDIGFYEKDSDGLHIIKKYKVISYNNSTIATIIDLRSVGSTKNDFNTIKKLYKNKINIVEPIETEIQGYLQYTLYRCPNNQIGIPFIAEYFTNKQLDSDYLLEFISEISTFIKALSTLGCLFPDSFVGIENRLKDTNCYYFFNIINFNSIKENFIEMQLEYFQHLLNNPVFASINKDVLFDQAKQQWQ
jgi:hypothetical protein